MLYKNKAGQPRERAMVAAYSLVTEFGARQEDVAKTLGCSQGTIANWVKEIDHKKQVSGLERDLKDAHEYISQLKDEMKLDGYLER
jgi:transposase-like protein